MKKNKLLVFIITAIIIISTGCASLVTDMEPIHWAAMRGKTDFLKQAFEKTAYANINKKDTIIGNTPLHLAIFHGHIETARYLIEKGANINARNAEKVTPLWYAASHGNVEAVRLLIENNADLNTQADYKTTPLSLAVVDGNNEIVQLLVKKGADVNLHPTLGVAGGKNGNIEIVRSLLKGGADITAPGVLNPAAYFGRIKIVQLLIEKGADINAQRRIDGETPLASAARTDNNVEMIRLLINKGAKKNIKGKDGKLPKDRCKSVECKFLFE